MGSDGVVVDAELIEQDLELTDCGGPGLADKPSLQGLVETFDLAAGLRVVRTRVGEGDSAGVEGDLQGDPSTAAGVSGEHRAVVRQQPGRVTVLAGGGGEDDVDVGGRKVRPQSKVRQDSIVDGVKDGTGR